jgi:hypothetical protein
MERVNLTGRATTSHVSWGAVFAGAFVGLGIWVLLHILGMGIGMTAIDPDDSGSLRGVGIGTGIWSLIAPLIGLFVGGLVAARVAGPLDRLNGAIHGAVVWALAALTGLTILFMVVSSVLGGVVRTTGQAIAGVGQAAGGAAGDPESTLATLGLRPDDLVAPLNQRLREEGKPAVTSEQIVAAAQTALRRAVREGRLDRELLVQSIARETNLSRADAEELAGGIEQRWNEQSAAMGPRMERAEGAVLQAAETTGKGLLALFAALALGLVAAIGGAAVGVSQAQRRAATRVDAPAMGPPHPTPIG